MTSIRSTLRRMVKLAEKRVVDSYVEAIASQLLEVDVIEESKLWDVFENEYRDAHMLISMIAASDIYRQAERAGMPNKPDIAQVFGRDTVEVDFEAGRHEAALAAILRRQPRTREHVDILQARAERLAQGVRAAEQTEALTRLQNVSVAFREAIKRRIFWASDVSGNVVVNLKELLADPIRTGKSPASVTLPEFIEAANFVGASHLTRARLEVVYRTNLSQAHNDGRAEALSNDKLQQWMPLVMLLEIDDDRSREIHAMMDGYVNTIDEFKRQRIVPPSGFNCRGTMRGVAKSEAKRLGLLDTNDNVDHMRVRQYNGDRQRLIDSGAYPDKGFRAAA